ncbi:RNA polymerase sigma factor [Paenibacillus sp. CC-CFT747]|nr:RNA polymerase sigma factor [Paenibacillus sp. CC-CFT747]
MPNHLVLLFTSNYYSLPRSLQQSIYYEFYQMVYPLIYFILKDHGTAEDIVQEAFLRAIRKADQLKDVDKLEGWIKTLARNVTLNHLRKFSRNREELDAEDVFQHRDPSLPNAALPVEEEVELRLMRQSIARYLDELKPDYRQMIEMRWIQNLSYKEMAAALNVTEGTVRQKLYRAREAIRHRFHEEWGTRE